MKASYYLNRIPSTKSSSSSTNHVPFYYTKSFKIANFFYEHSFIREIINIIIGLIILIIPLSLCIYNLYVKNFTSDDDADLIPQLLSKIKKISITNSIGPVIFTTLILIIIVIPLFIHTLTSTLIQKSFFNWNLRNLSHLLHTIIELYLVLFTFIKLNHFVFDMQEEIEQYKIKSENEFTEGSSTLTVLLQILYKEELIFKHIKSIFGYVITFVSYRLLINLLFFSHCGNVYTFKHIFTLSLCIAIYTRCTRALIIFISIIWLIIYVLCVIVYGKYKWENKKHTYKFYLYRISEFCRLLGVIILFKPLISLTNKYELLNINKLTNEITSDIRNDMICVIIGLYFITIGCSILLGKRATNFIVYPLNKRYLAYKHEKFQKYILRLKSNISK